MGNGDGGYVAEGGVMARRGRNCVVAGCEKKAAVGSVVCKEHRDTALGEQTDREIIKMTQRLDAMARYEEGEAKREAMREFRRQVMRGEYAALFSTEMMQALHEEGRGYGLTMEIGMMRVAMMRLMLEEENPSRMAHGLAKLSGALGKSMERQEVWTKAERQRRSVEEHMELYRMPVRTAEPAAAIDMPERVVAAMTKVVRAVAEPALEIAPSTWPRPGYLECSVDTEDVTEDLGDGGSARIARGR